MRKNSIKNTRINSEVLRELADIIRTEIKDHRIAEFTSVTAVEVAPDLKTMKAWISVLGDAEALDNTIRGLKSAEGFARRELARRINLRNTPEITFLPDDSIAYGIEMSKKIDEVAGNSSLEFEAELDLEEGSDDPEDYSDDTDEV